MCQKVILFTRVKTGGAQQQLTKEQKYFFSFIVQQFKLEKLKNQQSLAF